MRLQECVMTYTRADNETVDNIADMDINAFTQRLGILQWFLSHCLHVR